MATTQTTFAQTTENGSRFGDIRADEVLAEANEPQDDHCPVCGAKTQTEMGKRGLMTYCARCAWSCKAGSDLFTNAEIAALFGEAA